MWQKLSEESPDGEKSYKIPKKQYKIFHIKSCKTNKIRYHICFYLKVTQIYLTLNQFTKNGEQYLKIETTIIVSNVFVSPQYFPLWSGQVRGEFIKENDQPSFLVDRRKVERLWNGPISGRRQRSEERKFLQSPFGEDFVRRYDRQEVLLEDPVSV